MIQEGFSMLLSFGYDKTTLQYNLPDENLLGVLLPNDCLLYTSDAADEL